MNPSCPNDHCNGIVIYTGLVIANGDIIHERWKCVRCGEIVLTPFNFATFDEDTELLPRVNVSEAHE